MSQIFLTANYRVDPVAGTVIDPEGQECKIRPRTFQLLQLLLSKPQQNISKQDIMTQVWSDVVVGEHVVFQSIKEIRQVFEPHEVIKTVPKQGYTWIHEVESCASEHNQPEQPTPRASSNKPLLLLLVGICFALLLALTWVIKQPEHPVSGSIVILPVHNKVNDADHRWVSLGAMDQLIQRLNSEQDSGVLHTDYVLEVMARANLPLQHYRSDDIGALFTVSGASLVVEMTLTGVPQDYKLLYTLHRQPGSNKGVVFAKTVPQAIAQLANIVAQQSGIGVNPLPLDYLSGFSNELIANALLAHEKNDTPGTIKLLEAAVANQPDNLTAKRLLVEALIKQGEIAQADAVLTEAFIQLNKQENPSREEVRITFFAAINALQTLNVEAGEALLTKAEALATQLNEWLYLGYIAEARGKVAQHQGQYQRAEQLFQQAIGYHQVLHCPYGESNGYLNLSILADEQGLEKKAQALLNKALTKTRQHQLIQVEKRVQDWQRQLAAK